MQKPRWLSWVEFLPVALLLPILAHVPYGLGLRLARWLGRVLYWVLPAYRRVAHVNLGIALGGRLTESELRACIRSAMASMVQTFFELIRLHWMDREAVLRLTLAPSGYADYQQALAQGRGVIAVSFHLGNWYWPVICAAMEGHRVNVIVRPLDNPLLHQGMCRFFARWGVRVIARRGSPAAALAALRRGETLALMMDQNALVGGRFVPLFGVPASTMQGIHLLRRGSGAEVVALTSVREADGHRIRMHWLRDLPADADAALLALHHYFEPIVAEHRDQYFWLHPRWKKRPPGEPSLYPGLRV